MKFKLYFTVVFLILIGFLYYFSNTYQIEITLNNSTENSLKIIEEAQAQCYPNGFPFGGLYTTNGPVNGVCQKVNKYTGGCSCPSGFTPIAMLKTSPATAYICFQP